MNRITNAILVGAAVSTAVTAIAYCQQWTATPLLRTITVGCWIIYAIAACTELILEAITKLIDAVTGLREDITTYGELQRSDGVIDGLRHNNAPAQPATLTRVR